MLRINPIFTEVCNGSTGATQDDIVCGYIHPDDRVFAVLSGIQDLEYKLESLQIQLGYIIALMFVITIMLGAWIFISLWLMIGSNKTEAPTPEDEDQNHRNQGGTMSVTVSNE